MRDNDRTSISKLDHCSGRERGFHPNVHPYVRKVRSKSESRGKPFSSPPHPSPRPLASSFFFNSRSPCRFERCDDNTREICPRFANFVFATSNARFRSPRPRPRRSRPPPPVPGVFLYADCRQLLAIVRRKARETELRRVRTSGRPDGYHPDVLDGSNERRERARKRERAGGGN